MNNSSNEYHLIPFNKNKISIYEMVLVFAIASIIGYFIETGYVFLNVGKLVKRGMLIGPYCPIYGFGALIFYSCFYNTKSNTKNLPIIFIISSLILGSFELICGLIFKYILNIEMWNYSNKPLNILNYTTVPILIGWGILGTIYVYFAHPLILNWINNLKPIIMRKTSLLICFILLFDFFISIIIIKNNPIILDNLVNPENKKSYIYEKTEENLISLQFHFYLS